MIRRIISVALHQPSFVLMLLAVFVGIGVAAFRSLPVEAFPDVTDVQVTVITLFPGHAPEEVEKQVTIPLEIELSGLPNAVRMFSHTQFGLSYVILTFNDAANDYFARQQVLERLQGVELPPGVQPQLAPLSTAIGEIYRYRLQGNGMTPTELRSLQDWVVTRRLKMIPGVADVVSFGGFIKRYEVTVNTTRMKSYNVTLQQVFTALGRGNANAGGSFLEQGEQQYLIRGIGMLRSGDDIGEIVVAEHGGTPLLIRDIAEVRIGAVPRQGLVGRNDEDEIVGFYLDPQGAPHGYLLTDEGRFITIEFPGATVTQPRGINDRGSIAGQYTNASGTHAFLLSSGVFSTIDVPGAAATFGRGINQRGDVTGNFTDAVTRRTRGFVATKP